MKLIEEERDLFTVPQGYYLAQCISGDFALGAGIAKQFVNIYNMKEKLQNMADWDGSFCAILIDNVFNLVTKDICYHKPTYYSMEAALTDMATMMADLQIKKVAIPKIGCGRDRLEWTKVKEIIERVFGGMDVEILVCIWDG